MRTLTSKLLVVCVVLGLLALIPGFVQTADAAKWSFHFTYPDCPGGDLEVWATQDCVRQLQLVKGYAKNCKKYVGHIPGTPYNDLIFDFYWDYKCGNHDHIKIALPNWNGSNWELQELPPWIDAQAVGDIPPIVTVGDPNGDIQRVYIVVDPEVWRDNYSTVVIRNEYAIVDGTCPDLPGYLIGTTPITFNPNGPADGPFETTLLTGTLSRDGEIELLPEPPHPPDPCFEQLDWVGPFLSVPNSSWGKVTLEINQPRGFYYLNLSVDTDGDQGYTPVIQNMSVETTGEPQMVSSFFNIFADEPGVQAPYDVSRLDYMYSIDEAPQQEPPTGEPKTATVESIPYQVGGEAEVSVGDLPVVYKPPIFCFVKKSGQLPNLGAFVNQSQNLNECAPAAISNSLRYLQATGGIDATLDTSIGTVGGQIGFTPASGTPASWYLKKQQLPYFTQHVTTRYITPPLTDAKLDDLVNELNRGQDIEMDLKGHVEFLVGLRERCDGSIELDLFDDNQFDAPVVDPMHTSVVDESDPVHPRVDGMELERFVIECPIEECDCTPEVLLPYLFLDTNEDWELALQNGVVRAMTQLEGEAYMQQLVDFHEPGTEPYPYDPFTNPFVESTLNTHDAYCDGSHPDYGDPNLKFCDAGLVMGWGNQDGDSSSAWVVKYDDDPDLTNCIITLVVTAPKWSMLNPSNQINTVSFGLGNPLTGTGPVRSWNWACGSGAGFPIQWNTATTLTIDTSKTGTAAATPTATGYANNPAFNLATVTWLSVDENGTWVGGASPMPGPGNFQFLWNYWHWILVTPRTTVEKGIYKKWSQPPVVLDPNDDPPVIQGWDELSNFNMPVVADDWQCDDDRPVTDIHWWGSYFKIDTAGGGHIPWTQPIPPALPRRFHIGIWTNIPDPNVNDPNTYSRPDLLIWENYCDNYVWNFAGYDRDPRKYPDDPVGAGGTATEPGHDEPMDACFQFTQLLSQDEWFYQEPSDDPCNPTVYWLSIAPIWDDDEPEWQWGWKTRLPKWNDDAVSITQATPWWWPVVGTTTWVSGVPVQHPLYPVPSGDFTSWDVAFELTTNEPAYEDDPIPGDSNLDGVFDFKDLAITLAHWLERAPGF